jgi:hypothetical protein
MRGARKYGMLLKCPFKLGMARFTSVNLNTEIDEFTDTPHGGTSPMTGRAASGHRDRSTPPA